MNLSAPFIRRPIGTILLTIGLALSGVVAFFLLPVAPLPDIDFPIVSVQANLPGASPATMAATVASPLEKRLGTIAGIDEMTSQSSTGSARVTLQFDLSRDVDGAARDVQAAINTARADLPATLRANPTYRKANPAEAPVIILALTSRTRSPAAIYDAVSTIVQQRLLQVEGVGDVELGGAALPAVRVDLNPLALARYGVGLEDVRAALSSASANRPRGLIEGKGLAWQIYSDKPGQHAADYRPIVIGWRDNAAIRLRDVASVTDGPEDIRTMGLYNGERAVLVVVTRQPGANIVSTVDAVKAQIPALSAAIPADIQVHVASDRTATIRASLHEVEVTLLIAMVLVILVTGLFLRSVRAAAVPAVAVSVSLLGTLGVMALLGFSLDNLSLMALTISTGFVVDDAIVVLETISSHVERGLPSLTAAMRGAREVGFTVLSISVSLIAVFVPLLFMGGLIGELFREFAVTMAVAVAISLVVSLTVTPVIASLILRGTDRPSRIARLLGHGFDHVRGHYARSLDWALANRGAILILLAGTVALNVTLIERLPKGLFPEQDTGALQGGIRADQSISFNDLQAKLGRAVAIIRRDPGVATVVAFSGGTRAGGGFLFVSLKPKGERDSSRAIITRLRPRLARLSGLSVFLNPVQDLRTGGRSANSSYQFTLKADSQATLKAAGARLVALMKRQPQFTDIDIDQQDAGAQAFVAIDHDAAARLGVPIQAIDAALYDSFGQRQVANIYSGLNQYHVVMEVAPAFRRSPAALAQVYVPAGQTVTGTAAGSVPVSLTGSADASTGSAISVAPVATTPLSAVAHWVSASTPAQVNHQDGEPSATVSFNTANGYSLGQAADALGRIMATGGFPPTVHGGFAGTAKVYRQSTATLPLLIGAALLTIYIVLGILYESAIHPLTVLSTLPSAGVGAAIALLATGAQFDLIAIIGVILLIGLVKKNAIMIIDVALDLERSFALAPPAAIREASLMRLRPILMTTAAAILGALPLAIGFGDGAELRRPLGIAIIGGLLASQVLTLLTTPVVYLALDRFRRRGPHEALFARRRDSGRPAEPDWRPA